jgi:integrase
MAKIPLSAKALADLTCPHDQRKAVYRDTSCKGLALEVRSTGGRTWYLNYTNKRGQRRQHRLGDVMDLSLSQARALADRYRTQVAMGEDPAEQTKVLRQVPTFAAFSEQQLLPHLKLTKKSWTCDRSILNCHLLPVFGPKTIDTISRADVLAFQVGKLEAGLAAGTVYRMMVLLRHSLRLAIDWEVPGIKANPCNKVPLPKVSNERQRFLSPEEAQRLLATVRSSPNPQLEAIVTFLLLTGARKREALDARWDHIHWEKRSWFIPITKTGQPRHVTLSDGALVMLRRQQLKTGHSGWLFPNHDTGKPFKSVYYAWDTARKEAGLADVRMHDLRHSFASFLINDGRTLYEVQQLLGHRNSAMTQRYAHLAHETLVDASNCASSALCFQ